MADKVHPGVEHFQQTMGVVPEPIRVMAEHAPEALDGYLTIREYIYREPPEGHLDRRTKELVYIMVDVITNNFEGAKNHVRSGIQAGLTTGELAEALMIVMLICGANTWGLAGHKVMDFAAQLVAEGQAQGNASSGEG